MIKDFISLIYPENCLACATLLGKKEECLCLECRLRLPQTGFHNEQENEVARIFWGRVSLHSVASFLRFTKEGRVQRLMHVLKYKNQPAVGHFLGKWYGQYLSKSVLFSSVDAIIPVPLHPAKLKKRGYNQAEVFAAGIAETMQCKVDTESLVRLVFTETQTRKTRLARWDNVSEVFDLHPAHQIAGKHVLLTDDVLTTGATLEACARVLLQAPGVTVSIATLAYAGK
jgi:ComF family protein